MTDIKRRIVLRVTTAGSLIALAAGAGLLAPLKAFADWPAAAFNAKSVSDAVKNLYGDAAPVASPDIKVKAPDIAENGAVVPVTVSTSLPNVETIDILIEKNGRPMGASFVLTPASVPTVSTRLKVAESGKITAIVKSGGKLYSASKDVKVTVGGCGG